MIYTFIAERCSDLPVSVCCRVMRVSTSGFYQRRAQPVTDGELAEAYAANKVHDIWTMSRHSYGSPRVRNELRLGRGVRCSKTTCERLMRCAARSGSTIRNATGAAPGAATARSTTTSSTGRSTPTARTGCGAWTSPNTPPATGKVYLAVVVDAWSRRVVGWSIADHIRAELVADAIQMATWRRQPPQGPNDRAFGPRRSIHVMAVRQPAPRRRPARLDGLHRRLLRQLRRRGVLLRPAARAPRPTRLALPRPARPRDLRVDRNLVQPAPPPQLQRTGSAPSTTRPQTRHDHPHPTRPSDRGTSRSSSLDSAPIPPRAPTPNVDAAKARPTARSPDA